MFSFKALMRIKSTGRRENKFAPPPPKTGVCAGGGGVNKPRTPLNRLLRISNQKVDVFTCFFADSWVFFSVLKQRFRKRLKTGRSTPSLDMFLKRSVFFTPSHALQVLICK